MRYLAQRILTGEWLHKDLPLTNVERSTVLSGPGGISATITPELRQMVAEDGMRVIEEWATYVVATNDAGRITHGGIVTNCEYEGGELRLTAPGFTTYPHGYVFDGLRNWGPIQGSGTIDNPETPRPDPVAVFRDLWTWVQAQDDSDLGVKFVGTLESTATVGDYEEPYRLRWYDVPDIGEALDSLAEGAPFDYAEEHTWRPSGRPQRLIRIGFPRLGRRRDDLVFQQGVNVVLPPTAATNAEDFANYVMGLGNGEGPALRETRGDAFIRDGRLRRIRVLQDPRVKSADRMSRKAHRNLAARLVTLDVTSVAVRDHPDAPLSAISVGDDIYVRAAVPSYDPVNDLGVWVRVLSITQGDDESNAVLNTQRSNAFVYAQAGDYLESPTPLPSTGPTPVPTIPPVTTTPPPDPTDPNPPPPPTPGEEVPDEPLGYPANMLRVAVANMTWQQGHDRWLIRSLCNDHDILLLQETKNLDLNALLPDGWRGFIEGPYGSGRREPAFAIRRSRVTVVNSGGLVYAAETSNPGPDRYIRWARFADPAGNVGHFITCHYPLRRDERNQNHMDNVLRNHLGNVPNDMPVIFGGDVNQARGPFANRFNMDRYPGSAAAAGIMLLGTKRVYDVTRAGMLPDGKGRDHTIPFARIWMARG